MQNGRHVSLRPVDGERETGDQDDYGLLVDGVDLLHQLFLRKRDALSVAAFASVAGHCAGQGAAAVHCVVPIVRHVWTARRVVANHNHRDIRRFGRIDGRIAKFLGGIIHLDVRTQFSLDPLERRNGIRGCAAVPVPMDGVGQRPNHRNRLD